LNIQAEWRARKAKGDKGAEKVSGTNGTRIA
jgi:hypothetical protein